MTTQHHHLDPGALLTRAHELPSGELVRLRLPHRRDAAALDAIARQGGAADAFAVRRIIGQDPREQVALCAVLAGTGREEVLAGGMTDVTGDGTATIVCGDDPAGALQDLLQTALAALAAHRTVHAARSRLRPVA